VRTDPEIIRMYREMRTGCGDEVVGDFRVDNKTVEPVQEPPPESNHNWKLWDSFDDDMLMQVWGDDKDKMNDVAAFDKRAAKILKRTPRAIGARRMVLHLYGNSKKPIKHFLNAYNNKETQVPGEAQEERYSCAVDVF
jgi:hypothetical protein